MTRRDWNKARDRSRMSRQGSQDSDAHAGMMAPLLRTPRAGKAGLRHQTPKVPRLAEPVIIDQFWRNRRGEALVTRLQEYEGHVLIDVRVNYTAADGTMKPTSKGVSLAVLRLPDLLKAITKAEAKARELGLIGEGDRDEA